MQLRLLKFTIKPSRTASPHSKRSSDLQKTSTRGFDRSLVAIPRLLRKWMGKSSAELALDRTGIANAIAALANFQCTYAAIGEAEALEISWSLLSSPKRNDSAC